MNLATVRASVFGIKTAVATVGASARTAHELNRQQYAQTEELSSLNLAKRVELVRYAYDHSPFYRELYSANSIRPEDVRSDEDFEALPVVTRQDIRDNFAQIATDRRGAFRARPSTTGGSTGTPVTVLHDRRVRMEAALWRVVRWWGVEPHEDAAYVYRLRRGRMGAHINDLLWWPTRRIFLDAALMSPESMRSFVARYNGLRPSLVQGYVGALTEFAHFLRDSGLEIHPPKAVWVTAAPLSESHRTLMETVFGAPVYDQYGSCEIPWLAAECKTRMGLHTMHDIRHVEFVDRAGRSAAGGAWGRVVVTDLENRVFPLIRYDLGDLGRRIDGPCDCGVTLPLMDKVHGRESDRLRLPGGRSLSGEFLTTLFDEFPEAVQSFQVHQLVDHSIVLRCVPGPGSSARAQIGLAHRALQDKVGLDTRVSLDLTSRIPHDRGKTRYVISDVVSAPGEG